MESLLLFAESNFLIEPLPSFDDDDRSSEDNVTLYGKKIEDNFLL
jgi:hypothetical protein